MKMKLFYLKGKSEPWAEAASLEFTKKISYFFPFEKIAVKSKSLDRSSSDEKRQEEGRALISKIAPTDHVVLFDEKGKTFADSQDFSRELIQQIAKKSNCIVFVIGGPFGFSDDIRKRSNARWSLTGMTMNHHVAQVVALEQIYRALTIWKGLPYHNS